MTTQAFPAPAFTEQQREHARLCVVHIRMRHHHDIPVEDEVIRTAMHAAVCAVADYAEAHGVPNLPRWHQLGARRYEETINLVEDLLTCKRDMALDGPLSIVFHTTMLFTAYPLLKETSRRSVERTKRIERKAAKQRASSIHVRAYKILQANFRTGMTIGQLAQELYDLSSAPAPATKFYARTQGVLNHLRGLGRAETVRRGIWNWKRTPEEAAEIQQLHDEVINDTPRPKLGPVEVTIDTPEEIPEEEGEGTVPRPELEPRPFDPAALGLVKINSGG